MKQFEQNIAKFIVAKRWWLIFITLLIAISTSAGMSRLAFVNDQRVFFSKENPQLKALDKIEQTYTKNDNVLFALAPKNGKVFTKKTLKAVEELTRESWQIPYSSRVDSISNFQHTRAEGDDLIVEDLVENAENYSPEELEAKKKIALAEPFLQGRLISQDASVTGINITVLAPGKNGQESFEVAKASEKIRDDFIKKHPDIDIYMTGGMIMNYAFGTASKQDMTTLVPAMYLILLVILAILIRSASGTIGTMVVILISMTTGMGLAGWLGINLTPASANASTIILTLAVADSVHILSTFFQHRRKGLDRHASAIEAVRVNFQPVFLTSITTAIGFLSMNFSDAPPFRDLGNIVSMGVVAAWIYSVFFLPSLMAVLPVRVKATKDGEASNKYVDRFADFVIRKRKTIFFAMIGFIVVTTAGISKIELNDNFIKYFDKRFDFRVASDFVIENLTGFDIIEYSLESGESGGIAEPDYLRTVAAFADWYKTQPNVKNVTVITDTMKRLNKSMHEDDPAWYKVPDSRELAAQYLLLYEMSLPFGLDLNNQINVDKSATRMVVTLADTTTRDLRDTDDRARAWLKANAPKHMFTYGSGLSIMWAHISQRNINSMLTGSMLALVLISVIMIIALKSFKLGALSLIPNLVPAFVAFGIWGYFVGMVGLAVSVLIAMTLGIVVDDTVHFMSKYLRARREEGLSPEEAVRYSFHTVGMALFVTSMVLVSGFIVLSFSGFKVNSDIGIMSAITIIAALILDFLFLPPLLMKAEEEK